MGFLKDLFSSPKKPNAQAQVAQQEEINQKTQAMNLAAARTNQVNPFGSLNYSQTGTDSFGNPTYTATQSLTPERQAILDAVQGGIGGLATKIGNNYGEIPDFSTAANSLTSQMLDRQLAYISPYYTQQTNNLDNTLRNQGLLPGTPAYDNAMRTLRQTQNESIGTFINQAEPIAFNQAVTQYLTPINGINQLLGVANNVNAGPQLNTPSANVNAPDFISASNNQYKAELDARNQALGGVASIGAAILGGAPGTLAGSIGGGLSSMLGLNSAGTGAIKSGAIA
jgi:hypothetical protein